MKRSLALVLALALVAPLLLANEYNYQTISVTTTSATANVGTAANLVLVNDGSDIVYCRVFKAGAPPAAATSGDMEVKVGEGFEFADVGAVSCIAASSTATVRLIYS